MKSLVTVGAILGMAVSTCSVATMAMPQRGESTSPFEPIAGVLTNPRCANCHFAGDVPLIGDHTRFHAMVVRRGRDGRGTPAMRCTNCHQDESLPVPHAPPGAPDWRLPPPATPMAWKGLTTGEQCRMLKDPSKNGNKTLQQLLEHVRDDALVRAAWSPGVGRAVPPIPHEAFVEAVKTWIELGAACPE